MRSHDTIPVLVHALASTFSPADIPWQDMDPDDLFALSLDGIATVAETMTSGGTPDDVIAEIGNTIACLGMMADTIGREQRTTPKVMNDVRELGEWILTMAPEEIGHPDDENVVQTALRLLRRQYEDSRH